VGARDSGMGFALGRRTLRLAGNRGQLPKFGAKSGLDHRMSNVPTLQRTLVGQVMNSGSGRRFFLRCAAVSVAENTPAYRIGEPQRVIEVVPLHEPVPSEPKPVEPEKEPAARKGAV
jgi:hypothetical protein